MVRKKRMETMSQSHGTSAPIVEKMNGRVSKMSPGPAPGSMPAAKTAGMMAKPAMIANSRSKSAVKKPVANRSSSDLR